MGKIRPVGTISREVMRPTICYCFLYMYCFVDLYETLPSEVSFNIGRWITGEDRVYVYSSTWSDRPDRFCALLRG